MKYVAISHVWSDGLSNPHGNSMPICQLSSLHRKVQALYRTASDRQESPIPFWIDTMCCPTDPPEARRLAIIAMRRTYADADKVLVLDSYVQSFPALSKRRRTRRSHAK